MDKPYNYRNCQSLFGYAARVHARSGGICQLCGYGGGEIVNFDLWRQLTVEHLIGESQGGYPREIRHAIGQRFPELPPEDRMRLVERIDDANTVTACSFCNSTTSRDVHAVRMDVLISTTPGTPDAVFAVIVHELETILARKRSDVKWKLTSLRAAFDQLVAPTLATQRQASLALEHENRS